MNTAKRNGVIDTYRFLYALAIMGGHSVVVGVTSPFPFEPVGMFVEFFLFLSGFYACTSINNKSCIESNEYLLSGLRYTIKKYKSFLPYLAISVVLSYSVNIVAFIQYGRVENTLFDMMSEIFCFNYIFGINQRVSPLYYLAALLIVFPIYIALCHVKNNSIKIGIALYMIIFYYHDIEKAVTATYPYVLLRMFAGLCAGMIIHYIVDVINKKENKNIILFRIISVSILTIPLLLSALSLSERRIWIICEFFGLVIALSEYAKLNTCSNRLTDVLSKMSMVVFILHWSVGQNIEKYLINRTIKTKLISYFVITIVGSLFLIIIVDGIKTYRKKRMKKE